MLESVCAGSGGGAGWVGGNGGTNNVGSPGTSYLDSSVNGMCTGLASNGGNGYVTVTLQ